VRGLKLKSAALTSNVLAINQYVKDTKCKQITTIYDVKTLHGRPFYHIENWIKEDNLLLYADIKKLEQLSTGAIIAPAVDELLQTILRKYNTKVSNGQLFISENLSGINWHNEIEDLEDISGELITVFSGKTFTIGPGDVFKTLDTIEMVIRKYHIQVKELAPRLKGNSTLETCQKIWSWCRKNIKYAYDTPGYEELRTPARSWNDRFRGVDCDDFTILTSSILIELGYKPQLIIVAFNNNPYFGHIFTCLNCKIENNQPVGGIILL